MSLLRCTQALAGLGLLVTISGEAVAQKSWTPDPKSSLAWWQINPHMNHLWASTCPQEPSWRPGEGRSGGWSIAQVFRPPKHGDAAVSDTTIIPLYPRRRVRSVCSEAVTGELTVSDTTGWKGVTGWILVDAKSLNGGDNIRDKYTQQHITEINNFPTIKFTIDSLVRVTTVRDTIRGTAVGVFQFRGVDQPMTASVRSWREETGRRVIAKFHFPAKDLVKVYGITGFVLGMGVGTRIWYDVYGGVDLVMKPGAPVTSTE